MEFVKYNMSIIAITSPPIIEVITDVKRVSFTDTKKEKEPYFFDFDYTSIKDQKETVKVEMPITNSTENKIETYK